MVEPPRWQYRLDNYHRAFVRERMTQLASVEGG